MSELNIQRCPETGICSIIKADGTKMDLMPDEVSQVRGAFARPDAVRQILAEVDPKFAEKLDAKEIAQVAIKLA